MALFPNFERFKQEAKKAKDALVNLLKTKQAAKDSGKLPPPQTPKFGGTAGGMWSKIIQKMGPWGPTVDQLFRGKGQQIDPKIARELEQAIQQAQKLLESTGYQVTRPGTSGKPIERELIKEQFPTEFRPIEPEEEEEPQPKAVNLFEGMIPCTSSNVHSFGYKWSDETQRSGDLYVRYLGGDSKHRAGPGPLYAYRDVDRSVFVAMKLAASKGKLVWDELRVRGSAVAHQYAYDLIGTGPDGYIPRQASIAKRGRAGRGAFLPRTFQGRKSSLPEREFKGTRNITRDFRGEASRIRLRRGNRP